MAVGKSKQAPLLFLLLFSLLLEAHPRNAVELISAAWQDMAVHDLARHTNARVTKVSKDMHTACPTPSSPPEMPVPPLLVAQLVQASEHCTEWSLKAGSSLCVHTPRSSNTIALCSRLS